jgi:hypothetical protein
MMSVHPKDGGSTRDTIVSLFKVNEVSGLISVAGCGSICHTLKYLILECEYLSECVYPSLGFFKNFPDFSVDYSLFSVELNPFIGKF